jgi:hypothetical protein
MANAATHVRAVRDISVSAAFSLRRSCYPAASATLLAQRLKPRPTGRYGVSGRAGSLGRNGRIDDPNAGWQGRGLWVTSGNRTPFHIEGIDAPAPGAPGKTQATLSSPLFVNFQLRPDPLAH